MITFLRTWEDKRDVKSNVHLFGLFEAGIIFPI